MKKSRNFLKEDESKIKGPHFPINFDRRWLSVNLAKGAKFILFEIYFDVEDDDIGFKG
jgi:hypothetical protein